MPKKRRSPEPDARPAASPTINARRPRRRTFFALVGGLLTVVVGGSLFADWWIGLPDDAEAHYVGRASCIECHAQEHHLWQDSHHDLAMDRATPETVLGDFHDAELTHHGITSRMFRRGDTFMIHTEGPDGSMQDFEIKYVFGVTPLQQYMVEFDRDETHGSDEIGRLQVLRVSWDTEQQRWFHLDPPDVAEKLDPDDDLHWTGIAQRWNNMCADCHSTHLQKNYDHQSKKYHTTFSEIDVSCEACHGPGSLHVQMARSKSLFWDRKRGYGLARLKGSDHRPQVEMCGTCHARRRVVHPGYRPGDPFYDFFANELLHAHTYHADGQILDEVYVYGSFLQSKMYHKGIRCTDCHDPHTARLKHEGNAVCTSCHAHAAGKYDSPAHHHHNPGSPGAQCVACHMPATTYMEVDPRRDHSLRVPRPDLSVVAGTPNACSGCHLDKSELKPHERRDKGLDEYADWLLAAREGDADVAAALKHVDRWAAEHFNRQYGTKPDVEKHFANAIRAARDGERSAATQLLEIARNRSHPAIIRATGLFELGRVGTDDEWTTAARLLQDRDPQVRAAALGAVQGLADEQLAQVAAPLLDDPVRLVRTEAARILARVDPRLLRGPQKQSLQKGVQEFVAGMLVNNDRATAHMSIGILYESLRDPERARRAYETAIHVEPAVTGPRSNLAALLEQRIAEGQRQLGSLARMDRGAAEQAATQLVALEQEVARLRREELDLLTRDARLAPDNAAIQYRYGLALYIHGKMEPAEAALRRAVELEPNTPDFLLALALFYQQQQKYAPALTLTRKLVELRPENPTYRNLLEQLRQTP